jgi:putative ABC transport system permease protein
VTPLELFNRLRDRLNRRSLARELDDEIALHRRLLERDAGNVFRERFGNDTHYREETRDMWSLGLVDDLLQDLRFAMRAIRATPSFSFVVTLTLAIGIGATTAMYTMVDAILLRPLPYPHAESLVQLVDVQEDGRETPASYPDYLDWRERTRDVLSEVGVAFGNGEVLQESGGAEQIFGARLSANMPALLGVQPILGRMFTEAEVAPAAPRVVLLSEALWRSRFAGDRSIIGRTITLTGLPATVIGVFPAGSNALLPMAQQWSRRQLPDFWMPLRLDVKHAPAGLHWLGVIGRLAPGVGVERARARLAAIAVGIQQDGAMKHGIHANPLAPALIGSYRAPLALLFVGVAMLLIVACANVASLLLARAAARRREFAVRAALGAGRRRLVRLLLIESLVRSLVGGAVGIVFAYAIVAVMRARFGGSVARVADASVDGRVLAAAVLISLLCGVAFGLMPALRVGRADLVADLRDGSRGVMGSVSRDRLRRGLVVIEVALSFMLLVTAGLLARSVAGLLAVPTGFDTSDLIAGDTWLPSSRYRDSVSQKLFFDKWTDALSATFGATHVTLASDLPIAGGTDGSVGVEGRPMEQDLQNVEKRIVGTNYFDVLGAHLAAGRFFTSGDVLGAPPVVIINQTLARQAFPNGSAVGKHLGFDWGINGYQTVVGVVADLREGSLKGPPMPAIYISAEQRPNSSMHALVRTTAPATEAAATFRRTLRAIDPAVPLVITETMGDVVRTDTAQARQSMALLGAFALMALVLAAVGLYGVISYAVAQRMQELGIRAALGARPHDLMRLVVGQAAGLAVVGILVGLAGASLGRRLIAAQLFGVGASDPATLAGAAVMLLFVALAASTVPTRRAAHVNPLEALRGE